MLNLQALNQLNPLWIVRKLDELRWKKDYKFNFSSYSILEIGPYYNPTFSGDNVRYFDVYDRDEILRRAREKGANERDVPACIHFLSPTADLSIVSGTYDIIFASHCIEHQPDLISHLNQVSKLLSDGGVYIVRAPDKRYCFDYYSPPTELSDVIAAFEEKRTIHSLNSILRNRVYKTHNKSVLH